jgi:hypothetical protein
VADRGEPEAWCSEWHGDGTAGEDDRGSGLVATGPARAMGEARSGRHELRWQVSQWEARQWDAKPVMASGEQPARSLRLPGGRCDAADEARMGQHP